MTVIQQRLIYTAGTLKLNADMIKCRRIIAYADILRRPPSARYANERSNPTKRFYGYVSLWIGEYVQSIFPLEYDSQNVFFWDNLSLQLYEAILCTAYNTSQNIQALGAAMTPPAPLIILPSPVFSFPGCPYLWLKFKLEPQTRIQVTCIGEELEKCADFDPEVPPPPPPPPPPTFPPDRPLEEDPPRSDPEEGEQPGDTAPPTADDPDSSYSPFPNCTPVNVVISYVLQGIGPGGQTIQVFAPVQAVRPDPADPQNLELLCRGRINRACQDATSWVRIDRAVVPFVDPVIESVEPI